MAGAGLIVMAVLFLGLSATAVLYVVGTRSKSSAVRNAARRFHRAMGNPLQMRSAGTPNSYASVLRHQGRTTGTIYETPVWAVPTEDGFVIAIVYGSRTDWLKNVLASGSAAIVHEGATYRVERPEIVPMESARAYFSATLQRIHRLIRVEWCLRVRRVKVAKPTAVEAPVFRHRRGWARLASATAIGSAASAQDGSLDRE
jgi:deazaflavin-dependent oxidoreductase (nitroreductase family)